MGAPGRMLPGRRRAPPRSRVCRRQPRSPPRPRRLGRDHPGEPTAALAEAQRPGDRARAAARWDPATLAPDRQPRGRRRLRPAETRGPSPAACRYCTARRAGSASACQCTVTPASCCANARAGRQRPATTLRSVACRSCLLRGNGALTCGDTPEVAATRMWLLAVACQTWLTAAAAGSPQQMGADEAASWRTVQDELLPRLWLYLNRS